MKRVMLVVALLTLGFTSAEAYFKKGDFELGFSGTFMYESVETSYSSYYQTGSSDNELIYLGITPAYYLEDGFFIEPEADLCVQTDSKAASALMLNIGYTLKAGHNFFPFIKIGYGTANSVFVPSLNYAVRNGDHAGFFNASLGFKIPISKAVNFKTELNYRRYKITGDLHSYYYYNSNYYPEMNTFTQKISQLTLWCGLSINL